MFKNEEIEWGELVIGKAGVLWRSRQNIHRVKDNSKSIDHLWEIYCWFYTVICKNAAHTSESFDTLKTIEHKLLHPAKYTSHKRQFAYLIFSDDTCNLKYYSTRLFVSIIPITYFKTANLGTKNSIVACCLRPKRSQGTYKELDYHGSL